MFASQRDQFRSECKDLTDAFSIKGRKICLVVQGSRES